MWLLGGSKTGYFDYPDFFMHHVLHIHNTVHIIDFSKIEQSTPLNL